MHRRTSSRTRPIWLLVASFSAGCGILVPYPSSESNATQPPPQTAQATPPAPPAPPPAPPQNTPAVETSKSEFEHSAEEREAFIAENTQGYVKEGPPISRKLDGFTPSRHKVRRGKCYMMIVRLESGASFSPHAKKGLSFFFKENGVGGSGGPGVHGPGGVGSLGCPQKSGESEFDLHAIWGSADDDTHLHDLGTGPLTLQLMSKPVSEKELRGQAADVEEQHVKSCKFQYKRCLEGEHDPGGVTCADEYQRCMR
ncbi:hypothetical protein LZC95_34415 [Pendulispora brunnea]|uniref:Lipoprotein n=1 Tax=Pendulispora brunnea TaxID=2905690 RepID=A0ABZ2K1V7_9BACT